MEKTKEQELQLLQQENEKKLRDGSVANLENEKAIREWEFDLEAYYYERKAEMDREEMKFQDDTEYLIGCMWLPF